MFGLLISEIARDKELEAQMQAEHLAYLKKMKILATIGGIVTGIFVSYLYVKYKKAH